MKKLLILIFLGGLLLSPLSGFSFILVENNRPAATIVVSVDASGNVKEAAKILQEYIKQSTGAILPISDHIQKGRCLHVGLTSFVKQKKIGTSGLDVDGFLMREIDSQNFVILGGSDWGTEFGIYDFLERYLGVCWLMPTDLGVDVPVHVSLDVPGQLIISNPVFFSRQLSPIDINSNSPLDRWGHFNRLRGRLQFHHNLKNLFPPQEFARTNPDFYPLFNGKRYLPKSTSDNSWQPNFSANGIVDSAARKIVSFFSTNPTAGSYSLGMNDSRNFDESSKSLGRRTGGKNYLGLEDVSDDYFAWADAVVKKVCRVYPNKLFGTLAYNNIAAPPKNIKVDPHIIPFITYERMRWADKKLENEGHERTMAWNEVCPILGWYDYAYGLCYMLPRVWFHVMKEYLAWGAAHDVKYYYAELYPNWGEGPKAWILAKLLWNPNLNVDSLLNEWYVRFSGPKAAPKLKEFYAVWEKFWTVGIYQSKWNRMSDQYLPFNSASYLSSVSDSDLERADLMMQAACRLAGSKIQKARVAKLNEMWQLYKMATIVYQQDPENRLGNIGALLPSLFGLKTFEANKNLFRKIYSELKQDPLFSSSVASIATRVPYFKKIINE